MGRLLSASRARTASRLLQFAIVGILLVGLATRNLSVVVNAVLALGVTLLPALFARDFGLQVDPGLVLLLTVALFLHTLGMLGLYAGVWWYDHVTHTVSAALVAALSYGGLLVVTDGSRAVVALLAVGLTIAGGVCWELIELVARALGERFDIEPVLVHYGWDDTAYDLGFDLLGALAVVALDVDVFAALAAQAPAATETALTVGTAVVVGGSVAMAVALTLADAWPRLETE
jgi:phage shock protein PspC (stress-responsive transcriptional regulator)